MDNAWLIVTDIGQTTPLLRTLACDPSETNVLAVGTKEVAEEASYGTKSVLWIDTGGKPADVFARDIANTLTAKQPRCTVGYATSEVRAAMGLAAKEVGGSVISNVVSVAEADGNFAVDHTIIDGKVTETLSTCSPAFLLCDTLTFMPENACNASSHAEIKRIECSGDSFAEIVDESAIPETGLESAQRVIGIGRGVASKDMFEKCCTLAQTMDAEITGSMSGVRDLGYFEENASYVGVSGVHLNANLYVALGISGATAHRNGLLGVKTVVCVNNDPDAALFSHADYGIVGDVEEVVPALIKALG